SSVEFIRLRLDRLHVRVDLRDRVGDLVVGELREHVQGFLENVPLDRYSHAAFASNAFTRSMSALTPRIAMEAISDGTTPRSSSPKSSTRSSWNGPRSRRGRCTPRSRSRLAT